MGPPTYVHTSASVRMGTCTRMCACACRLKRALLPGAQLVICIWVCMRMRRQSSTSIIMPHALPPPPSPPSPQPLAATQAKLGEDAETTAKRVRALRKKLRDIEVLIERQTEGAVLQANQLEKITMKAAVEAELAAL